MADDDETNPFDGDTEAGRLNGCKPDACNVAPWCDAPCRDGLKRARVALRRAYNAGQREMMERAAESSSSWIETLPVAYDDDDDGPFDGD